MTTLKPLIEACPPRPIHQSGDQYAADLMHGLEQELNTPGNAETFLAATHLTKATDDFLRMAMDRVARGAASTSPAIYQLYNRYGGGKTHSLLMLAAAARHPNLAYWHNNTNCQPTAAKIIAFDGTRSAPDDGMHMGDQDNRAKSLAGYILYHLAGESALSDFRRADENLASPGVDAFQRLIRDTPTIIIIDELVQYISKANKRATREQGIAADGVVTTISELVRAVANCPRAVLVITSPEDAHSQLDGSSSMAGDAFPEETRQLADILSRVDSELARVTQSIAPSGEADLAAILRKRLFESVDGSAREAAAQAYAAIADRNGRNSLSSDAFYDAYPFHPAFCSTPLSLAACQPTATSSASEVPCA